MNAKTKSKKKKLCWNCEGSTSFEDENCPYCGVYLSPMNISGKDEKSNTTFDPPYRLNENEKANKEVPAAPYAAQETDAKEAVLDSSEQENQTVDNLKATVIVLGLLLAGFVFMLFGFAMFLFGKNGFLTLQWNANYWYVYLILAMPMLFYGWRTLLQIKEE